MATAHVRLQRYRPDIKPVWSEGWILIRLHTSFTSALHGACYNGFYTRCSLLRVRKQGIWDSAIGGTEETEKVSLSNIAMRPGGEKTHNISQSINRNKRSVFSVSTGVMCSHDNEHNWTFSQFIFRCEVKVVREQGAVWISGRWSLVSWPFLINVTESPFMRFALV